MADASGYVLTTLARNWWALVLRGAIGITFGLVAWVWPGLALYTLIVLFAFSVIIGGVLSIVAAIKSISARERWLPLALEGVIGIGAGLVALIWPDLAAKTFLYIIAIWAILSGLLLIASAIRLHKEITNEWLLGLAGVASIFFGAIAIARPLTGALAVLWLIGISSIFAGALLVVLGWRLRAVHVAGKAITAVQTGVVEGIIRADFGGSPPDVPDVHQGLTADHHTAPGGDQTTSGSDAPDRSYRLSRRERALQELIDSLPPEGEGWVRGNGTTNAPSAYPLKGNINSRIYHRPGGQSYHETIAEVHFASDEGAVAAGFRPRQEPDGATSPAMASTTPITAVDPTSVEAAAATDTGTEEIDVAQRGLDPVGADFDGTLETLDEIESPISDEIGDEYVETEISIDDSDEIEVTGGAAASWQSTVDQATESGSSASGSIDDVVSEAESTPGAVENEALGITYTETALEVDTAEELDFDAQVRDDLERAFSIDGSGGDAADLNGAEIGAAFDAALEEGITPSGGRVDMLEAEEATAGAPLPARREGALDALIAGLSPEGEGWARGLGGYRTPTGFPVKGNASSMLYHMPGGRNYAATIPEICFATAEDARTGGFRPRSGDPTEIDWSLVEEVDHPAASGAGGATDEVLTHEDAAVVESDPATDALVATLPPEGEGWVRGLGGYQTPTGYPVKGNASSMLYHMPGGRNYAATIPEICFGTAEDARTGGFRPRSGDPTEIDWSLVEEIDHPAGFGIRDTSTDDGSNGVSTSTPEDEKVAALIAALPPEGTGWVRGDGSHSCPAGYEIKGNASSSIYHVPTGGSHDVTVPEFCFASTDDAEAAGFRAARN